MKDEWGENPLSCIFISRSEAKTFSLSKRLDLLFVFSLDINPGRELTEWKQSGGREASGKKLCHLKFDYLIYASLRSVYEAGEREWDLSDFHPALEVRQKSGGEIVFSII